MLKIPHYLNNRLTELASPVHRQQFTPQKHDFAVSGIHFCYRLSKLQGLVRPEELGKLKDKLHHRISNQRPSGLEDGALAAALPFKYLKLI
jgi:hypothetical protein